MEKHVFETLCALLALNVTLKSLITAVDLVLAEESRRPERALLNGIRSVLLLSGFSLNVLLLPGLFYV